MGLTVNHNSLGLMLKGQGVSSYLILDTTTKNLRYTVAIISYKHVIVIAHVC